MVKKASDLDFDALAKLAKAATDEVRVKSALENRPLPVWLDGKVVEGVPEFRVKQFLNAVEGLGQTGGPAPKNESATALKAVSAGAQLRREGNG